MEETIKNDLEITKQNPLSEMKNYNFDTNNTIDGLN